METIPTKTKIEIKMKNTNELTSLKSKQRARIIEINKLLNWSQSLAMAAGSYKSCQNHFVSPTPCPGFILTLAMVTNHTIS